MMLTFSPARLARMGHRLLLLASFLMLGAWPAVAGEALSVAVNKVEVINLERDANIVLIANPTIADVAVESERLIFLFGLEPGETNILVLDAEGNKILSSPVVVVPNLERQVTINRASVNEEATYTCAPRCAAIETPAGTGAEIQSTGSSAGVTASEKEDEEAEAKQEEVDAQQEEVEAKNIEVEAKNKEIDAFNKSIGAP